jgi:alkylhydroperoxidase/carboxymuconolactone decarboxylase family protein YurZ
MINGNGDELDALSLLEDVAPNTAAAVLRTGEAADDECNLDEPTRHLVNIGILAALNDADGVHAEAHAAREAGVSRAEAIGAVLLALASAGTFVIWECLPAVVAAYDYDESG